MEGGTLEPVSKGSQAVRPVPPHSQASSSPCHPHFPAGQEGTRTPCKSSCFALCTLIRLLQQPGELAVFSPLSRCEDTKTHIE